MSSIEFIKVTKTAKGNVHSVEMPDGGSASVRNFSNSFGENSPTLQISSPTGQKIKIRYGE